MAQSIAVTVDERLVAIRVAFREQRYEDVIDEWHRARDSVLTQLTPAQRGEMVELAEIAGMASNLAES